MIHEQASLFHDSNSAIIPEQDACDILVIAEAREHDFCFACRFWSGCKGLDCAASRALVFRPSLGLGSCSVESADGVSRFRQMPCHGASHNAKA